MVPPLHVVVPHQQRLCSRLLTTPGKRTVQSKGTPRGGSTNNYTANLRSETPSEYVYKDICLLSDPDWTQAARGAINYYYINYYVWTTSLCMDNFIFYVKEGFVFYEEYKAFKLNLMNVGFHHFPNVILIRAFKSFLK